MVLSGLQWALRDINAKNRTGMLLNFFFRKDTGTKELGSHF